jgi:hypothetical protein
MKNLFVSMSTLLNALKNRFWVGAVIGSLLFLSCVNQSEVDKDRAKSKIERSQMCNVFLVYENQTTDTIILKRSETWHMRLNSDGSLLVAEKGIIARKILRYDILDCDGD